MTGPSTWTSTARSRSAGCAASRATSASSCAPTRTSCRWAPTGCAEASDTAVLNANYLMARLRELCGEHLPVAFDRTCMHEFVLSGGPMKKALGIKTLRPRQAAARPRLPPADGLLPAAGRRGAADRADRDRDARDARRLRRGGGGDPRGGGRGSLGGAERAATTRRCGGSTRPAPPSARSSASRCRPSAHGGDRPWAVVAAVRAAPILGRPCPPPSRSTTTAAASRSSPSPR